MPSIWFSSFSDIDWSKALGGATSMVEKAKTLFAGASGRQGGTSSDPAHLTQPPPDGPEALAAVALRVQELEKSLARLEEEVVSSFDVVRALTEQHSQLASAVDVLITRTKVLLRVCVMLGIAVVALLALVVIR